MIGVKLGLIRLCHFVAHFANMAEIITLVQTLQYG